jgi:hypothetical protein
MEEDRLEPCGGSEKYLSQLTRDMEEGRLDN